MSAPPSICRDEGWLVTNVQAALDRRGLGQLDASADPLLLSTLFDHAAEAVVVERLSGGGDVESSVDHEAVDRVARAIEAIYS